MARLTTCAVAGCDAPTFGIVCRTHRDVSPALLQAVVLPPARSVPAVARAPRSRARRLGTDRP